MNEVLKEAEIEVPAASKHWDGQRAYDKRLVTLMSKDAGIKITARKTVKKRTQATNGGTSDVEGEDENDGSQLPGRGRPKAKPLAKASDAKKTKIVKQQKAPRPQTLPTRRSNRATVQEGTSRYAEDSSDIDVEERSEAEKRREGAGGKRAASPSASEENEEGEASENAPQENGTSLPKRKGAVKPSPKRPRETESEEEEENDEELPPPLVSQQKARKPGTTSATNGEPGPSSQPVMSLSTQDLAETEPFSLDLPDTPPGLDSQSDAGSDAPRRKRSRY